MSLRAVLGSWLALSLAGWLGVGGVAYGLVLAWRTPREALAWLCVGTLVCLAADAVRLLVARKRAR